jgi:hypothetical protein
VAAPHRLAHAGLDHRCGGVAIVRRSLQLDLRLDFGPGLTIDLNPDFKRSD